MREMIELINENNRASAEEFDDAFEPVTFRDGPLEVFEPILMIDGVTRRRYSPQMQEFFALIDVWPEAYDGKTILSPRHQGAVLEKEAVKEELRLTKVNFAPHPPAVPGDERRTVVFAHELQENWLAYLWWETDTSEEPCVIDYNGSGVDMFASIRDFLSTRSEGYTVSEAGMEVEARVVKRPPDG